MKKSKILSHNVMWYTGIEQNSHAENLIDDPNLISLIDVPTPLSPYSKQKSQVRASNF